MREFKAEISYLGAQNFGYPWHIQIFARAEGLGNWSYLGHHSADYRSEKSARKYAKSKLQELRKHEAYWPTGHTETIK